MTKLILALPDPNIPFGLPSLSTKLVETLIPGRISSCVVFGTSDFSSAFRQQIKKVIPETNYLNAKEESSGLLIKDIAGMRIGFATKSALPWASNEYKKHFIGIYNLDLLVISEEGQKPYVKDQIVNIGSLKKLEENFCLLNLNGKNESSIYMYKIENSELKVDNFKI